MKSNKKAQVTIFIIIAIVVVAIAVLFFLFFPEIKSLVGINPQHPSKYLEDCMIDSIEENIDLISSQGGVLEPEHYYLYQGNEIEYLCYTEEYYQTCVMQRPFIVKMFEESLKESVNEKAQECLDDLKSNYERQGYTVRTRGNEFDVELLPQKVVFTFNTSLAIEKENAQVYDNVRVVVNDNSYELLSIANSILDWEATLGDSETTTYMNYYHDLKVEKLKQSDGTTIYILSNRNSEDKFQFASRSLAWPPGYAFTEVKNE